MKQINIKNIILIAMVLVCIYLSSNVWLKLPDIVIYKPEELNKDNKEDFVPADIWNVVRPIKNIIKINDKYTILYSDEQDLWGKAVHVITDAFNNFDNSNINETAAFPSKYMKFDFNTNIPVDIFSGFMKIKNQNIHNTVRNIKNIIIDLDNPNSIYIYNGENTLKIENENINTQELSKIANEINFENETKYVFDQKIVEETIQVPIPLEKTALNPVFVKSELDVFDTKAINKIAKDYFKNNYEYVRKSVEVNGNLVYMYRSQKILKINAEGLLDFYDVTMELENQTDVFEGLVSAVNFTNDFLGFPKDVYLSSVDSIEYDGNYGFRYAFSYKVLDRPILFSKVRENLALQIDVVGDNVVSYKRFIRDIDDSNNGKMNEIQILPAADVILKNLIENNKNKDPDIIQDLTPLSKDMLKDISNIYLGYFDISRISKEQVLRVVWVVEVGDRSYIFNAITGSLLEEW